MIRDRAGMCAGAMCVAAPVWRAEFVIPASRRDDPVFLASVLSCRAHIDDIRHAVLPFAVTAWTGEPTRRELAAERAPHEDADCAPGRRPPARRNPV